MKFTHSIPLVLLALVGLAHDAGIHLYGEPVTGQVVQERMKECTVKLDDGRRFKLTSRNCEKTGGHYILFMGRLRLDNNAGRYNGTALAAVALLIAGTMAVARRRVGRTQSEG